MRCAVKRQSASDERSAGNPHATFCGSRGRYVAPGDPVAPGNGRPYRDTLRPSVQLRVVKRRRGVF